MSRQPHPNSRQPVRGPLLTRYLVWQGEVIDTLTSEGFPSREAFHAETRRLRDEYALAGMAGSWKPAAALTRAERATL